MWLEKNYTEKALGKFIEYKEYLHRYSNFLGSSEISKEIELKIQEINIEFLKSFLELNDKLENSSLDENRITEFVETFYYETDDDFSDIPILFIFKYLFEIHDYLLEEYNLERIFYISNIEESQESFVAFLNRKNFISEKLFNLLYKRLEKIQEEKEDYYRVKSATSGAIYSKIYLDPEYIKSSMQSLIKSIKERNVEKFDFMLEAIYVKSRFVHHIHPFDDINGRISRMIMQYILFFEFYCGYPLYFSLGLKKDSKTRRKYRIVSKLYNTNQKKCYDHYVWLLSDIFINAMQKINKEIYKIEPIYESWFKIDKLSEQTKKEITDSFYYYRSLFD